MTEGKDTDPLSKTTVEPDKTDAVLANQSAPRTRSTSWSESSTTHEIEHEQICGEASAATVTGTNTFSLSPVPIDKG
jgi:hypothetical protein